ncbi:hypothetical protein Riv7116_3161 [Rivularia sp. PCC 7116]|uniref:hypothetical protein n=1 Tax=Rivularia sp. PCC 7116 TaxID=373994 RepID=UPI00029F370F|nr:hypothetical protein [Rivularia sp. PCC 7116]AFY55634.1 hypothetical protein Riv7116_3161 [Rivularia sp. PCC 7116]
MISINKSLAVIALALIVGCSDKDSVNSTTINSIPEETSQATTQSSNPVAVDKSQAANSPQRQVVVANNSSKTDNSQASSSQNQPVAVDNSKSDAVNDTLIIPGKRVGSITAETTRADLVKIYGESNLKDETILQVEGTVSVPATKVNQGTPGALTIFWKDETRKEILYIRGFGSQWKTPEGIGVGTSLSGLREILGEFKLTGFGWDYGGLVNFKDTKLSKYRGKLSLTLNPGDENVYGKYPKQYGAVSGDIELSSTNPNLEPLDVRVYQMTVNFGE